MRMLYALEPKNKASKIDFSGLNQDSGEISAHPRQAKFRGTGLLRGIFPLIRYLNLTPGIFFANGAAFLHISGGAKFRWVLVRMVF